VLKFLEINEDSPETGRTCGRALVNTINFAVISMATAIVRRENQTLTEVAQKLPHGIDTYNEVRAIEAEAEQERSNLEEQGFTVTQRQLEVGALLLAIRDYTAAYLLGHAQYEVSILDETKTYPVSYHIGETIEAALDRQTNRQPVISESRIQSEATAFGVDSDLIRAAIERNANVQKMFMIENREKILLVIDKMRTLFPTPEDASDAFLAFSKLPAINKARLLVAVDNGLIREIARNLAYSHERGNAQAKSRAGMLASHRSLVHEDYRLLINNPNASREIEEEVSRGATRPVLTPLPTEEKKKVA